MLSLTLPVVIAAASLVSTPSPSPRPTFAQQDMSFFITSVGSGDGANLGGLAGADKHCATLAEAAGVKGKTWHAYLSQQAVGGAPAVNARDRIGKGPWKNAKGVVVATSVDDLHSDANTLSKENSLTEKGAVVNGRGDTPNMHDVLTGSTLDGRVQPGDGDSTCSNWTSNADTGSASVGHHDRQGGGANPTSWNFAHASRGCGQKNLQATGGNGLFYCFAT
ncbi:MAG: hypothetical protein ACK6DR_11110 [Gemmatimonas sp.]|jgi:hypothetical protein|uniref:hypothetical protein n=2 Tax=Gemmatimonas sp. TaxID=1962908 RepID=UPI0025BE01F2|nr:hypothetical protein [Gemmatimonas sp.]MCA2986296.1 hypothetical protein [Gemmatimonas sp.]MCA2995979.1 hypothetical protein [Gemmatimonas sp.]MCE2953639.1 hypothetical protein [Gemmatimonas sp.]